MDFIGKAREALKVLRRKERVTEDEKRQLRHLIYAHDVRPVNALLRADPTELVEDLRSILASQQTDLKRGREDEEDSAEKRRRLYTDKDLCQTLARWGRESAEKMVIPPSAGPSSSAQRELDSGSVIHIQSSPIPGLDRNKIFMRACYRDIFARIWRLMQLWIKSEKAKLARFRESDSREAQPGIEEANPQPEQEEEGKWCFTLTGLAGVGKSVWILCAVAMFFQQKEIDSVFLQQTNSFITQFTRDGIIKHLKPAEHIPELTNVETALEHVLIFDGMEPQMVDIKSPAILVTSSSMKNLSQVWSKMGSPEEYNMPMWDLEELRTADLHEQDGGASIEDVIAVYGAKASHCLPAGKRTTSRGVLEKALDLKDIPSVIDEFSWFSPRFSGDRGSHVLVGYDVDDNYKVTRMFYASEAAKDACLQRMEAKGWTGIKMLLLRAASASNIIELAVSMAKDYFRAETVQRFDQLANVVQGKDRVLQVPKSRKLEAVDALMGRDICFQVTYSATHEETAKGLIAAFKALDSNGMADGKAPKLVFVVPRDIYENFRAQRIILGVGRDGKTTVKKGPQLKVEGLVAQFVLAVDFVPDVY